MLRKPVLSVLVLALFVVFPKLAAAQGSASPAEVVSQPGTSVSDTELAAILGQAPEAEELPGVNESPVSPIPMACPWTYYKCVRCTPSTIKQCEYWGCSGTLKGCGPCLPACAF